jgi:sulfatase modifying factor 1
MKRPNIPVMRVSTAFLVVAAMMASVAFTANLHAQMLVNMDTVTVGDAGNAADTTDYGAVANVFAIGKYEVTISQYTTFLNSAAAVTSDSYIVNLWEADMATDLNCGGHQPQRQRDRS